MTSGATSLLLVLARACPRVRARMVDSPFPRMITALHAACVLLRHNSSGVKVAASVTAIGGEPWINSVRGYARLPYDDRSRVLTCLVFACSNTLNEKANAILDG